LSTVTARERKLLAIIEPYPGVAVALSIDASHLMFVDKRGATDPDENSGRQFLLKGREGRAGSAGLAIGTQAAMAAAGHDGINRGRTEQDHAPSGLYGEELWNELRRDIHAGMVVLNPGARASDGILKTRAGKGFQQVIDCVHIEGA
jgi:hypothetical protein